ncbi:MAG: enoyl-CoA hydratase/isomerase family protein [Proteobacteria bacterium]|nr:enoyl-CoA hydratase/isomerase family protein [Pseudomonadota bacterium]
MSIHTEQRGPVTHLTLDRPAKKNALSLDMVHGLKTALAAADANDECRAVVLRGAGGSFCAGRDLAQDAPADRLDWYFGWDGAYAEMLNTLLALGKPVIAAVEGHAVAGGFTVSMCCHFVIARANARFGALEMRNGFPAAVNTAVLTSLLSRRKALELLLSADTVGAAELDRMGLITRVVPESGNFDAEVNALAAKLAALDARAVNMTLELARIVEHLPLDRGVLVGKQMNALLAAAGKMTRK